MLGYYLDYGTKMKFKVSTTDLDKDEGILYILEIHLEDKQLVKIGITRRNKIEERVIEILTSIFKRYREFPYCRPKRFKKTESVEKNEKILHEYFKEYNYTTKFPFGGHTEIFDIPLDAAVEAYEKLLNGEELGDSYVKSES